MAYQLVVVRGRSAVGAHRLGPGVTVAGRQEGCQLRIHSSQVSRRHCELFEQAGRLIIKDLGSSNGTFVNGERVDGLRPLNPGDVLIIGNIKFRVEEAQPAALPVGAAGTNPAFPSDEDATVAFFEVDEEDDDAVPLEFEADSDLSAAPSPVVMPVAPPTPPPVSATPADAQLGEDAVADFLLNLDVDDDDKV